MKILRLLGAALLAAAAGCFPADPPSDLQIACRVDLDCPAQQVCNKVAGLCVLSGAEKPPELVGRPVIAPAKACRGVTLTVSLAVNEALLSDPVVKVGDRRLAVDETGTDRNTLAYRFAYKVAGTEPAEQPVPVTIELTDTKGNESGVLPGGEAWFDFQPPPAPDVLTPGKVVYHRVPWGAEATQGQKRFWIEAGAAATEKAAQVVAYDSDKIDEGTASELGRTVAAEDGSFLLELMRTDRPEVYLVAYDAAGNPSPVADVKDVSWVATMAGKVPGREFENPHDYELRPWFERRYYQDDAQPLTDAAPISAKGGKALTARGDTTSGAWMRKSVAEIYNRRSGHGAAYDASRGKMVVFGGAGWSDTWQWDGAAWSKRVPLDPEKDGNPGSRSLHALAYDPERDRVVLFGGMDFNGYPLDDTWEWDGSEWVARPAAAAPPARFGHAMAWDASRGKVVLFGGETVDDEYRTTYFDDLWEWDGTAWTRIAAANGPSGRSGHAMAYDGKRQKLVVFGGKTLNAGGKVILTKDTWEWDGTAWARVITATPPSARTRASMAFLPESGAVLFGGDNDVMDYYDDTWIFDGTDWRELAGTTRPDKRSTASLVYDSRRNRAVLCGGKDETDSLGDTWELEDEKWVARTGLAALERAPDGRSYHAMAQDEERGVTVLFGGAYADSSGNNVYLQDTWEWDGTRWVDRTPPAGEPNPGPRMGPAMAYDRVRKRVVLFGGVNTTDMLQDTWEWDGTLWKERTPADAASLPPKRYAHAMAFDDKEGEVLLFGGTDYAGWISWDDTWLWDGAAWREARLTGYPPSGRCYHAMAYDRARERVVLYGGQSYTEVSYMCPPCGLPYAARDTYEWDGGRWKYVEPQGEAAPTTLVGHAMAYSQRGPVLMFGGGTWLYGGAPLDETWAWDGASWTQAAHGAHDDGSPEARSGHTMVYDAARSRAVLFGGYSKDNWVLSDTWEWDDGSYARPGQVARFAFAAAMAGAGIAIESVTATWVAGGLGETERTNVSGVSAWVWDHGSFMPASSGSYPPEQPGVVTWTTSDPDLADRLLSGPRQEISLAITPQGANGTRSAQVSVDDVELEVRYRRP